MADNRDIFIAIGRLQSSVDEIKDNTAKIPDLTTRIDRAETSLHDMRPKVEQHQKIVWVGSGVMAVFSTVWTAALAWLESSRGGHS
jgi:hypothetical protein